MKCTPQKAIARHSASAAAKALKKACGQTPFLVSGVSGEGVTELLRAAFKAVQARRAEEGLAPQADDLTDDRPADGGWRP